jgi:crotonobetainyl-CoA:carnitine CoA-transferase CaiB-like acyl-CoA transferase
MIVHHVHDGWVALQSVGAPDLWARLLRVMKRPDLGDDVRFSTPAERRRHWPELRALITEWLDGFASTDEALTALTGARLPCSRMLSPTEVAAHPHLAAREFFPDVGHPTRGKVRVTAVPFHVDGRALAPSGPAPYRVGEHSRTVLSDMLAYSPERIEGLIGDGVVGAP